MENNTKKQDEEEGLTQLVNFETETDQQQKPTKCDCKSKVLPFIPLSVPILFVVCVTTTYAQAVIYGHVEPIFPYFSDAGTRPPEAAYFNQMLNILSVSIFLTGLIRYCQIKSIYYNDTDIVAKKREKILRFNKFSFIAFTSAFIGMSSVGVFRVTENFIMHFIAAFVMFFGWIFLAVFETKISILTVPNVTSHRLARSRRIILIILIISFVICMAAAFGSGFFVENVYEFNDTQRLKWAPEDGGYYIHIISTVFEWIFGAVVSLFIGTFYLDFKKCTVRDRDIRFEMNK